MPMKGARSKVPLSGHFKWLSQCQDWFTKSGCHLRILKLETWNFAWDLILPITILLYKKRGSIWELFEKSSFESYRPHQRSPPARTCCWAAPPYGQAQRPSCHRQLSWQIPWPYTGTERFFWALSLNISSWLICFDVAFSPRLFSQILQYWNVCERKLTIRWSLSFNIANIRSCTCSIDMWLKKIIWSIGTLLNIYTKRHIKKSFFINKILKLFRISNNLVFAPSLLKNK